MHKYCVLITFGENGKIEHAYVPDLHYEIDVSDKNLSTRNMWKLNNYLKKAIKAKLENNKKNKIRFQKPKSLKDYRRVSLEQNQVWIQAFVSFKPEKGFMATTLPIIGHVSNVVALVAGSLISLAAIAVTVGKESKSAIPLGITGAILNLGVMAMLYFFSNATQMLRNFGHFIDKGMDKMIGRKNNAGRPVLSNVENAAVSLITSGEESAVNEAVANRFKPHKYSKKAISAGVGASTFILINAALTDIKVYQETRLLGERFKQDHEDTPMWSIDVVVWAFLTGATLANLAFQLSFGLRATKMVENHYRDRTNSVSGEDEEQAKAEEIIDIEDEESEYSDNSLSPK